MKKDNPFATMLGGLSERDEDNDRGPADTYAPHKRLTPAEMVQHLKVGYGLLTRVPDLKPGDIIRGIRELTESHIRHWDDPHILLEILPAPVTLAVDGESVGINTAAKRYDCIIASVVPHKGHGWILRHYADLRDLELYPGAEQLKVDTHS